MKITKARRDFKDRLGQANHFLITTLVGLNGIQAGIIKEKPQEFSTSWNPKEAKRSAIRSRSFVLKSFLGWGVESLEMYLITVNRKPKLVEEEDLLKIYASAGQSIYKKAMGVGDYLKIDPLLIALMDILITWRNCTFHYDVDNEIRPSSENVLFEKSNELKERFCGLEISRMIDVRRAGDDFSFKETAALIRATHEFVEKVDGILIQRLNFERYCSEVLEKSFQENKTSKEKYCTLSDEKLPKFIAELLKNKVGIPEVTSEVFQSILVRLPRKLLRTSK